MDHPESAQPDMSAEETRELARLATAGVVVMIMFAIVGFAFVLGAGDVASGIGAAVNVAAAIALFQGRREVLKGHGSRASILLVVVVLLGVLVLAPIPPPVPALGAAPVLAVCFALSFLHGRRLAVALVAAFFVSITAAIMVEVTPASPDLPPELAAAIRVGSMAVVTALVGLFLYRHRRRLELAVTRARASAEALTDSEARYRTVVEDVREVIFRIDGHGRWSLLNRAWEELTGYHVAESLGKPILDFVHADDRENHADLIQPVAAGVMNEYRHELRIAGADGQTIWVEVRARPLHDGAGLSVGMSGTLTDITARRALEERLLVQAFHDDLTGLANRALFKNRLEHALTRREDVDEGGLHGAGAGAGEDEDVVRGLQEAAQARGAILEHRAELVRAVVEDGTSQGFLHCGLERRRSRREQPRLPEHDRVPLSAKCLDGSDPSHWMRPPALWTHPQNLWKTLWKPHEARL